MSHAIPPRAALRAGFAAALATGVLAAAPALASNGYFANGYGAPSKAMAGAGITHGEGPLAPAQNPALGVDVGNVAGLCFTGFMPHRKHTNTGTGALVKGEYQSENEFFPIVCGGANYMVRDDTAVGLVAFGNGGMNTEYTTNVFANFNGAAGQTNPLGVDLAQAFVALNVAHRVTDSLSVGAAPVFAAQQFKAYGLEPFANFSTDSSKLTGNGYDRSYGGGIKLGANFEATPWLSLGLTWQSRMYMTKFDKYAGLFAEHGDFDIPAYVGEGIGIRPAKDWLVMLEHQRIFYSDVKALGTSHNRAALNLGADNGAGFGWKDMDIFRIGVEYQATDDLKLRAGASHASDFTDGQEVLFNILAPATIKTHVGVGMTYRITPKWSVTGSYLHAFSESLTGSNPTLNANDRTELQMDQDELSLGFSYKF